jgi:flagellar motor switch protein FliN/FliY
MNQKEIDALMGGGDAGSSAGTPPELNELGNGVAGGTEVPMAMLMDLTLPLSIELGRTRMTVQDILRLGRGSVVQLERLAGEPIDLYVADRRFAEGEVVVLGEHFGVRITRIISNVMTPEGAA